jgi:hypothetical protein
LLRFILAPCRCRTTPGVREYLAPRAGAPSPGPEAPGSFSRVWIDRRTTILCCGISTYCVEVGKTPGLTAAGCRAQAGRLRPAHAVWVLCAVAEMRRGGALAAGCGGGCCAVCAAAVCDHWMREGAIYLGPFLVFSQSGYAWSHCRIALPLDHFYTRLTEPLRESVRALMKR